MLLKRVFEKIVIRSGQFLLSSNNIELNQDRFRELVEDALGVYSKFNPYDEHVITEFASSRRIQLTDGLMQNLTGKEYLGTPDWISDVMPVRLYAINPLHVFRNLDPNANSELSVKSFLPFEYRKPNLYVSISGEMDLHCVWKHKIVETETVQDGITYDLPTISSDDNLFLKLVQGMFLQGLGKSRRAFTLNDLPITMDASEIAAEGSELEREVMEQMENDQKFYLAFGG